MHQPETPLCRIAMNDVGKHGRRLRRHSPVFDPPFGRVPLDTPPSSYGYAFVISPWIRGCGVRNATRRTSSTPF
jgi:hypothetical protein